MTRRRLCGALLVLAAAAALAGGCGEDDESATTAAETTAPADDPAFVGASELQAAAERLGQPIYWVGERPGANVELVDSESGRVYVRYLDEGAEPGVRSAQFLTVATYPERDPVAALRREAKRRPKARLTRSGDGAIVLIDLHTPNSVYLAYPGGEHQVEVYSPDAREVLQLVNTGAVEAIR